MNNALLQFKSQLKHFVALSVRHVSKLLFTLLLSTQCAFGGTYTLVPAQAFHRESGKPVEQSFSFTANDTTSDYTFNIYNGGLEGSGATGKRVSSSTISLNDEVIFSPNEFNPKTSFLTKQVPLSVNNSVAVTLKGKPGGLITIVITGEDNNPPTITASINPVANASGWHKNQVVVSFTCSDSASGIASCTDPVTLTLDGAAQTITGTAEDVAGNITTTDVVVNLDSTAPIINATTTPAPNAAGWNNTDLTVSFICSDALSGILTCNSPVLFNTEGQSLSVSGVATDKADNSAQTEVLLNVDKTLPEINVAPSPLANSRGWNNSAVQLTYSCLDTVSGIADCPVDKLIETAGSNQVITDSAVDVADNTNSVEIILNVDKTPPVITLTLDPLANAAGWNNVDTTLNYACTDDLSGILSCSPPDTASIDGAAQTFTGVAVDLADNAAQTDFTLNIDKTSPVITAAVAPAPNAAGWNSADVTVSYSCTDVLSGVSTCADIAVVSTEGADINQTGTAVDVAGNNATASVTLNIDKTSPTLTIVAPANSSAQTQNPPLVVLDLNDNLALDTNSLEVTVNDLVVSTNCQFTATQAQCTLLQAITGDTATIGASIKDMAEHSASASTSFAFDSDGDGFINSEDVFPNDPAEWTDLDLDGIGDNADLDRDGDGISNAYETQVGTDPNDAGSTPPDLDTDGIPDSLDDDRDGDGVVNTSDVFPDDVNESSDLDSDGIGDNADLDRDGDGISNAYETQLGTDPNDASSTPPDLDADGIPDTLDDDRDGDGVLNTDDVFPEDPAESLDLDSDGIGDNADLDRDGDGISNDYESQLGTDPNDATNTPPDLDADSIPDSLDDDRDGDGVSNTSDIFPDDASESSDLDSDGIGDNADLDRDGDGISNAHETQVGTDPDNAGSTPPDQDGDAIPDSLDDDRDGDGVNNEQDSYPDDPTRTKFAAVQNLTTQSQDTQISINWQLHPESFVQGYQLYRADYAQANWTLLNTAGLITDIAYVDSNVTNGQAYQYRITAVDDRNNESVVSAVVNQFIIYNLNTVSSTQAQWSNYKAQIDWAYAPASNETYRLYRLGGAGRTLVLDNSETLYLDNASLWSQAQNYELVTVVSFTNPITSSIEQVEGAVSSISLQALAAMNIALTNAVVTGAGSYKVEIQSGSQLSITGTYANALTDTKLTLTTSQGNLTVNSNDGKFQFVVRDANVEVMSITLAENGAPVDRKVTISLNVTADQTLLALQLNSAGGNTTESNFTIDGQVINADAGVKTLLASSNRYEGQSFGLILLENNNFTGELPLKTGDNLITVNAKGNLGQTAQAMITVNRQANAIPSVEITSHQNNQTVTTKHISLQGRLYTSLELGQLQFFVDQQPAAITRLLAQVYQFTLNDVELNRGYNRLVTRAQTPLGSVETALVIYYQDASVDATAPLELSMTSPIEKAVVNDTVLVVRGQLFNASSNDSSQTSLSINGVETPLFGNYATGLLFSYAIDISAVPEGPLTIDLVASSTGKEPVSKTINVSIDNQAPVLTINNVLTAPPAVNEVREQPYRISGSVSDTNLSTLSINGQGLTLQSAIGNSYSFDTGVSLNAGEQTTLTLLATDKAGNATSLEYQLLSNPQASLELIQPLSGTQYRTTGATYDLEFITRINGTSGGEILIVKAGTSQQNFPITQEIVSGTLTINTADTIDSLNFEVQSSSNEVLAGTEVAVSFINQDNLPLSLTKTNPAKNTKDHEPHTPIQFYFNKPVSLNDLTVTIKQSYHGTTYKNETISGAGLSDKYKGEVIEVHQDQAPVAGSLSLLPGERMVEFYPDKDLSFGASVFVEIKHQGVELARFIYNVRNTPTFIKALVNDQNGDFVGGIKVTLPELGIEAVTDSSGGFTVAGRGTSDNTIATDLYRLVINPNQANANYGISERLIKIENGQVNTLGNITVAALNPDVPYRIISSGVASNILVAGDLVIDTLNANLKFSDGSNKGAVHVQLMDYSSNTYQSEVLKLSPLWMYNLQPAGIEVTGSIGLQIKMPRLYGSHDYIPAENTPVLLMGVNKDSLSVVPVGVGTIINKSVVSQGGINLTRLDYLGYTLVPEASYTLLQQYLDNSLSLDQLNALLSQR